MEKPHEAWEDIVQQLILKFLIALVRTTAVPRAPWRKPLS